MPEHHQFIDTCIEKGILFLLVFTPLAFGTVQPWSVAVMEIIAFTLFFLYLIKKILEIPWSLPEQSPRFLSAIRHLPYVLCLLFFLLCLFQLLPLPEALLKAISPSSLAMYRDFSNGPADAFHPVSLNRMQLGRHSFASSVMQPYFLSLSATTAPRIKYIPW